EAYHVGKMPTAVSRPRTGLARGHGAWRAGFRPPGGSMAMAIASKQRSTVSPFGVRRRGGSPSYGRRGALAAIALAASLGAPGVARAVERQSGLQLTPDQSSILVSKDLAGERWAITRSAADGSVCGNVYPADGSAPQFVWCSETGMTDQELSFSCY